MTEFGSDRYLEKCSQSQSQSQANSTPPEPSAAGLPQSQFILPLRGSSLSEVETVPVKSGDQKRPEKRGFGFLRNKFHVKGSAAATASNVEPPEQRPSSTHSTTTRRR
jgi:hypothetical protein